MDPAELLERRQRGIELAVSIDRLGDRPAVGERQPVLQRLPVGHVGGAEFDGEADEVVLGVIDVEPQKAHALAAPQLHRKAGLLVPVLESGHRYPPRGELAAAPTRMLPI